MSTRTRYGSALEWAIAAACIVAALGLGSVALQEIRTLRAATPVNAEGRAPVEVPAAVPSRSVSVPILVLSDGGRLYVGERVSAIAGRIKPGWQVGVDSIERTPAGNRVTRSYHDGARSFMLVLEASEDGAEPSIAAIYLR
jgi:hypothetical protein